MLDAKRDQQRGKVGHVYWLSWFGVGMKIDVWLELGKEYQGHYNKLALTLNYYAKRDLAFNFHTNDLYLIIDGGCVSTPFHFPEIKPKYPTYECCHLDHLESKQWWLDDKAAV